MNDVTECHCHFIVDGKLKVMIIMIMIILIIITIITIIMIIIMIIQGDRAQPGESKN